MIRKSNIIIFLFFTFLALLVYDFNAVRIKNEKQYALNSDVEKKKADEVHRNFNYSDILNTIEDCSSKFILRKIEKDVTEKNYINTEVKYNGEIDGLIEGLKIMKMQEIVKGVNEISIGKTVDKEYTAEINVDFFKFK